MTEQIAQFLRTIGISVEAANFSAGAVVPGILIKGGSLLVDEALLAWPGDLLHEAAHLAMALPKRRSAINENAGEDGGEELGAIAWSWAALLHLGLDPEIVFHSGGYRGGSLNLIDNFQHGRYIGVPFLRWIGLTGDDYPVMIKWLRD